MYFFKFNLTIFFSVCCLYLFAQSPELLKPEGKIPREFITPSTKKYKKQVQELKNKKNKQQKRKENKQFLLESGFAIDDILQSGLVLFNDPATVYINKVLDQLPVKDRKITKKKPRAYVLNTSAVNAFANDQGLIFVTLGLLANLENEAQLAFILAHELMHIKHQHGIDKFIKNKEIDKGYNRKRNFDQVSLDKNLFEKSFYSRKTEEEADEEGLELFLKSNYDPSVITNTFSILYYSYLPFEDYPFEKDFFEDQYYQLDSKVWLEKVNAISAMDEDKDEEKRSTHPSSAKRLQKLKTRIKNHNTKEKKSFILPESEFRDIQSKARYQIPFLELYTENLPDAIYTAHLNLEQYPDDLELKKVIGKALYMDAKWKNFAHDEGYDYNTRFKQLAEEGEGSIQQIYHLLANMEHKEMTVLATKYNWKLLKKNPNDTELQQIMDDLATEFIMLFDNLDDFKDKQAHTTLMQQLSEATEEEAKEESPKDGLTKLPPPGSSKNRASKKDKIKQANKSTPNWYYALVAEKEDKDFQAQIDKGKETAKEREKDKAYYESERGLRELAKRYKVEEKWGKQLDIKKVVVVNPFYLSLDDRRGGKVQYIRSEEKQTYFSNTVKSVSKQANVHTTILDVTQLSSNDVDKFNDIVEINQYFGQQMEIFDLTLTPSYNQETVNTIAEKYGTDYFLWTGVISLREKNKGWGYVIGSIFIPYVMPIAIYNAAKPRYDMLYYAILFDVKTGRRSVIKMDYFDKRDNKSIINAHVYDVFHQIRAKPKRNKKR